MTGKQINLILLGVLVGVLLGGMLGAVIPDAMLATAVVGKLFVNALALVAIVLILVGFPLALARYGDIRRFDGKAAGAFVITVSSAVVLIAVGVVLVRLIAAQAIPQHGFTTALFGDLLQVQTSVGGDYLGVLLPETLMRAVLNGTYLGWVLFALIIGLVLPEVGTRGRTLQMWLDDLTRAMLRISELLLVLAPIALIFVAGALVSYANGSFSDLFSTLWYPIVLVLAVVLYCGVVLPLAIKWWQKVPESRGQRDDSSRPRDRQMMSSRPGQRPMGQDRGGRGRDQRFDRNRDRDRSDRDRGDRPRGDRDDRNRGDRDERGDRDRGRRDFRREGQRDSQREDSPFAVGKAAHVFDPEAPSQAVQLPELAEETTSAVVSEDRPTSDTQVRDRGDRPERTDRGDRGDRGPRGGRDRDRRGGGRDRQGRNGGRDRGRGPRRYDRQDSNDTQVAPESAAVEAESSDFDAPSDLSRVFEPVPESESNGIDRGEEYQTPSRPENDMGNGEREASEEPEVMYGRGRHAHRAERHESDDSHASQPAPSTSGEGEPKPIDHYSTDGIEFGRTSRRKHRR